MIISLPLFPHKIVLQKASVAVAIVWLFQLTAMLGISIGYKDWFITKTPLNLMIQFALLLWVFSFRKKDYRIAMLFVVVLGFVVEAVGTNFSYPFGAYTYGQNLGFKLFGVPLLIALNWGLLSFATAAVANALSNSIWIRSLMGGVLMVLLDFAIEVVAPQFDFWVFDLGFAPWNNYLSWFALGFLMNLVLQKLAIKGNWFFAFNLYISQLLFFLYFAFL